MVANSVSKVVKQWDALTMIVFTGLLGLSTFLCRSWFDEIRAEVRGLIAAKDIAIVEVAHVKTQQDIQWSESQRRFDNIEKKIDVLLERRSRD
jgi:hypothetical protein